MRLHSNFFFLVICPLFWSVGSRRTRRINRSAANQMRERAHPRCIASHSPPKNAQEERKKARPRHDATFFFFFFGFPTEATEYHIHSPPNARRDLHRNTQVQRRLPRMASCLAQSAFFCSAGRPSSNGKAAGGASKRTTSTKSKLWTPRSAAVDSPTIIVEPDAEGKMRGLTAKRREVILDMEDFAENEVRAAICTRPHDTTHDDMMGEWRRREAGSGRVGGGRRQSFFSFLFFILFTRTRNQSAPQKKKKKIDEGAGKRVTGGPGRLVVASRKARGWRDVKSSRLDGPAAPRRPARRPDARPRRSLSLSFPEKYPSLVSRCIIQESSPSLRPPPNP